MEGKVLEALKGEPKGVAALAFLAMARVNLMEAVKVLEELVVKGLVEKRGKTYRLRR